MSAGSDRRRQTLFPPIKKKLLASEYASHSVASRVQDRPILLPPDRVDDIGAEKSQVSKETPWKSYKKDHDDVLGGPVAVVYKVAEPENLFSMRTFLASGAKEKLSMIQEIKHENFLRIHEIFEFANMIYIVSERMEISLYTIVRAPRHPEEIQVAAIVFQVIITSNCGIDRALKLAVAQSYLFSPIKPSDAR
jgi:hypothetical protein